MASILFFASMTLCLFVAVGGQQDFQQGLSIHNQQIQEHLRKEQEVQRLSGFQQPQPHQPQYQPQQQNNNNYGQFNGDYNNNQNNNENAQVDYEAGLRAHMQQIQAHLAKESSFHPQQNSIGDPAYQQGLQAHQRQIQEHLAKEGQYTPAAPQQYQQQQQQYQPQPQQYQPQQQYNSGAYQPQPQQQSRNQNQGGFNAPGVPGLDIHQRQIQEHLRQEQQQQATVGQASQYHQSLQQSQPQQYNNQQGRRFGF